MGNKIMNLIRQTWAQAKVEPAVRKRDILYHQVTILREMQRMGEEYGEEELKKFFELLSEVQK